MQQFQLEMLGIVHCDCWLVTADERSDMHLVNLITCEQIAIPSAISIEQVRPIFNEHGVVHKYEFSWHTGMHDAYNSPSIFALDKLRHEQEATLCSSTIQCVSSLMQGKGMISGPCCHLMISMTSALTGMAYCMQ